MANLQKTITEKFLASLASSEEVTPEMRTALEALLASDKKVKADDFIEVFKTPAGGTVT